MAGFSGVEATLQSPSLNLLGFAFAAFIAYGIAQGRLVGDVGRRRAWFIAVLSAVGFCVQSEVWVHGAILVAFGLVGIGVFAALVVALSRVLGVGERPMTPVAASGFRDAANAGIIGSEAEAGLSDSPARPPIREPLHST